MFKTNTPEGSNEVSTLSLRWTFSSDGLLARPDFLVLKFIQTAEHTHTHTHTHWALSNMHVWHTCSYRGCLLFSEHVRCVLSHLQATFIFPPLNKPFSRKQLQTVPVPYTIYNVRGHPFGAQTSTYSWDRRQHVTASLVIAQERVTRAIRVGLWRIDDLAGWGAASVWFIRPPLTCSCNKESN